MKCEKEAGQIVLASFSSILGEAENHSFTMRHASSKK